MFTRPKNLFSYSPIGLYLAVLTGRIENSDKTDTRISCSRQQTVAYRLPRFGWRSLMAFRGANGWCEVVGRKMSSQILMTVVLHSLGNASHEPGSSYDAHARPAALYAPSWHDASPWDGTWSDAPWCNASWPDDARPDAWTNAPASKCVPCLLKEHVVI